MSIIDDYVKELDVERAAEIERIRGIVMKVTPGVGEVISYNLPALTYNGKPFLAVASTKDFL